MRGEAGEGKYQGGEGGEGGGGAQWAEERALAEGRGPGAPSLGANAVARGGRRVGAGAGAGAGGAEGRAGVVRCRLTTPRERPPQ